MIINFLNFRKILLLFVLAYPLISYCQTTPCQIDYKRGGGISNTRLIGLHEDLLLVSDTGAYKIVNIDKISHIRFDNGNYLLTGAGIGAGIGFAAGFVLYQIFGHKKNKKFITNDATLGIFAVFTLPSAIIGGLVGLLFRNKDDYDLSKLNTFIKSKEINYIMKDHDIYR